MVFNVCHWGILLRNQIINGLSMANLEDFEGQWIGSLKSKDYCIMNIDVRKGMVSGRVSIASNESYTFAKYESTRLVHWFYFKGEGEGGDLTVNGRQPTLHDTDGDYISTESFEDLCENYPKFEIFNSIKLRCSLEDYDPSNKDIKSIVVQFESDLRVSGNQKSKATLTKDFDDTMSIFEPNEVGWEKFKELALCQDNGSIFRGQPQNWSLKTSFHRTGRADLVSYLDKEVPDLERHVNATSLHTYDISSDKSLGALLNLGQHHGYPTPLLDWTRSPFVAAYFAFANEVETNASEHVTIFMFKEQEWVDGYGKHAPLRTPNSHVAVLELPIHDNPRVMPQQSVIMYSNVVNIESYIKFIGELQGTSYLSAFQIPVKERKKALRDLSLMGITKGSLFPGLDGICQQLKVRHFES
jgi:hypothetical protein